MPNPEDPPQHEMAPLAGSDGVRTVEAADMFPADLDRPENPMLPAQHVARPRVPADNPALYRDTDVDAERQKADAA